MNMILSVSSAMSLRGNSPAAADPFTPASLFADDQEGVWFEASDLTTLFQDAAGTVPVTDADDPIGKWADKSGNGNDATQETAGARPVYQTSPARATLDKTDDELLVTVPTGGFIGTMVISTSEGTAAYGVNIPAGPFAIGANALSSGYAFPGGDLVLQVIRNGALTADEIAGVYAYAVSNGGGPIGASAYAGVTDFSFYWEDSSNHLTSIPAVDTSAGTIFNSSWAYIAASEFPLLDVSEGEDFSYAWSGTSLTSFPSLNFANGVTFEYAWFESATLATFPANSFDNCTALNFGYAFQGCALTETSVDNILVSVEAAGTSNGTLSIDGGTNSAPGVAGLAAKAALELRGWTVTTN